MKLYLAHPLEMRHEIRRIELGIEERTGVELLNPFYDTGRDDIHDIDEGKKTRHSMDLNPDKIVHKDLDGIDSSDGVVAYLDRTVYQIGTICEMWYTLGEYKPIYVVSSNVLSHPWVRYMIEHSAGKGFNDWAEFEAWLEDK